MIRIVVVQIMLTLFAGIFYWVGGQDNKTIPWGERWMRPVFVSLGWLISMVLLYGWDWWLLCCTGLLYGSLTTYWKKKGTDARWYNWFFTGLGYSLASLPLAVIHHVFLGWGIKTLVLTGFVTCWSVFIGNDFWEENGRGWPIILTNYFFKIGV